jgi:RNA polymerase sigma-70 factor, ECF subfamily
MSENRPSPDPRELDLRVGRAWRDHRRHVLDIAFRMLGSISEAEDVVQEAFARLVRADLDEIDDVGGWLVVVVGRLCLDQLRSARWQRQRPLAAGAGDDGDAVQPAVSGAPAVLGGAGVGPDPADRVTLDDSVRHALDLVIERLTPAERTAFVLHDIFQMSFEEVGSIVGRSPTACRQLASRARRHIRDDVGPARFRVEPADRRRLVDRFMAACATGNLDGLLAVLDPAVSGQADVGGPVGLGPLLRGADTVARGLLLFLGPESSPEPTDFVSLPAGDDPAVAAFAVVRAGRLVGTFTLTVEDGRIGHIRGVLDPDKLGPAAALLGARSR